MISQDASLDTHFYKAGTSNSRADHNGSRPLDREVSTEEP